MAGYYTLFQSEKSGEWYFNLKAGNHEIILQSEGYTAKSGAENGIASVRSNGANDDRYERKSSDKGNYWFLLKAGNGQTIGKSEMYTSASSRDNGIESVKKNAPSTDVRES
ncbi:YegP family protein [Algiphilus sp.]|uniref:YegP family protein n=1 Tax=Algiphilus sp. TaxID=1872431 RepID=UPI003B52A63E